jgi:hypothetical protein
MVTTSLTHLTLLFNLQQDSSVSKVTGYGAYVGIRFPAQILIFLFTTKSLGLTQPFMQ